MRYFVNILVFTKKKFNKLKTNLLVLNSIIAAFLANDFTILKIIYTTFFYIVIFQNLATLLFGIDFRRIY